jgi:hypothetical protein
MQGHGTGVEATVRPLQLFHWMGLLAEKKWKHCPCTKHESTAFIK